jgi:hypothetical protein
MRLYRVTNLTHNPVSTATQYILCLKHIASSLFQFYFPLRESILIVGKPHLDILTDLYVIPLSPTILKKWFFINLLSVCSSLEPGWLDGLCSYSVFRSFSIIGYNISARTAQKTVVAC